jgi:phosphoglycolate phosphatase-like HAD superfamily hydrolase
MTKISSQKYLDQAIVNQKIDNSDFIVTLATISDDYQVVIDGHHSLEAAKQAGVDPIFVESDYNYMSEVECIGFDNFLAAHYIDSAWYDVESGCDEF